MDSWIWNRKPNTCQSVARGPFDTSLSRGHETIPRKIAKIGRRRRGDIFQQGAERHSNWSWVHESPHLDITLRRAFVYRSNYTCSEAAFLSRSRLAGSWQILLFSSRLRSSSGSLGPRFASCFPSIVRSSFFFFARSFLHALSPVPRARFSSFPRPLCYSLPFSPPPTHLRLPGPLFVAPVAPPSIALARAPSLIVHFADTVKTRFILVTRHKARPCLRIETCQSADAPVYSEHLLLQRRQSKRHLLNKNHSSR